MCVCVTLLLPVAGKKEKNVILHLIVSQWRSSDSKLTDVRFKCFMEMLWNQSENCSANFYFIFTAEDSRFPAVRNGDKVTLHCDDQSHGCSQIDWLFVNEFRVNLIVNKGKVSQQEYPQLSLTSNCSLEILNISEKFSGQFNCRWTPSSVDLATYYLAVVSCEYLHVI